MRKYIIFFLFLLLTSVSFFSDYIFALQNEFIPTQNVSLQDGYWDNPAIWSLHKVPDAANLAVVKHTVRIPGNFFGNYNGDAAGIVVFGKLIYEPINNNTVSKFYLNGDLTVLGELSLSAGTEFHFLTNSKVQIEPQAKLVLFGSALNVAKFVGEKDCYFNLAVAGKIMAKNFVISRSTGLSLKEQGLVLNLSNGKIVNVAPTASHIVAERNFKAEQLEFDENAQSSGQLNVKMAKSGLSAWLLNCKRNNTLADDGNVEWRTVVQQNYAADFGLQEANSASYVACGDVNNDGWPDIWADGLYLNVEGSSFKEMTVTAGITVTGNVKQAIFADYNNDGLQDILFLLQDGTVQLWENIWNGEKLMPVTFKNVSAKIVNLLAGKKIAAVTYVALSKDGLPDLCFVTNEAKSVLLEQDINHNFALRDNAFFTLSALLDELVVGQDFYRLAGLAVSENVGVTRDVLFADEMVPSYTFTVKAAARADFNRDGIPDVYLSTVGGGNELYLGKQNAAHWLTVKIKPEQSSGLFGARIVVAGSGYEQSKILVFDNAYAGQDYQDVYFNLGSRSVAEQVSVYFSSGKVFTAANVSLISTASLIVNEQDARPYVMVSGMVLDANNQLIKESYLEAVNVDTSEVIASENVYTGHFVLRMDNQFKNVKIQAVVTQDLRIIKQETVEKQFICDTQLNFKLPQAGNKVTGNVLYNEVPFAGIYSVAIPVNADLSNEVTKNTQWCLTNAAGEYVFELSAGEYLVEFRKGNQFLMRLPEIVKITASTNLSAVDLQESLVDVEDPKIASVNLEEGQVVVGKLAITGLVSDDVLLKNYELFYAGNKTADWVSIFKSTTKADGLLGEWNTLDVLDGNYQFKLVAEDALGKKSELLKQDIQVQNITAEIYKKIFEAGTYLVSLPFKVDSVRKSVASKVDLGTDYVDGKAFWLKVADGQQVALDLENCSVNLNNVTVNMLADWNVVGNPFHYTIDLKQLQILVDDQVVSMDSAVKAGIVSTTFWKWTTSGWQPIKYTAALEPWTGFLVKANKACKLIFPKSIVADKQLTTAGLFNDLSAQASSDDNWYLKLTLKNAKGVLDTGVVLGSNKTAEDVYDANDAVKPALEFLKDGAAGIYFPHQDWGANNGYYALDVKGKVDVYKEWPVTIAVKNYADDECTIELSELNKLPQKYSVRLFNLANNEWIDLENRANKAYTFATKGLGLKEYPFLIQVEDVTKTLGLVALAISDFMIYPNPFDPNSASDKQNKVRIKYDLNNAVTGSLDIYAVSGRLIRSFEINPQQYGLRQTNTIEWDGRDKYGQVQPNDVYLVLMRLRDDFQHQAVVKGKIVLWKK